MQTVIETSAFIRSAKEIGMTDQQRADIVSAIAATPDIGELIPGSGGARKVRFAAPGRGKSGGYRVITFYAAEDIPVFLLDVYSKGRKADLAKAKLNDLRAVLIGLPAAWRDARRRRQ